MTANPIDELLSDYQARRARAMKASAGHYADTRRAILNASDGMLARVAKARETLRAIDADLERGVIAQDQAPKLRRAVQDDVRSYLDKTAGVTEKVLRVLPDRLVSDALPLHIPRSASTGEAKADLDRELAGVPSEDLPVAIAEAVTRRYAEGDALGGDLLLSSHGRDRLAAAGVPEADRVHEGLRRELASKVGDLPGERGQAQSAMVQAEDWAGAYVVGLNVAHMMLSDLEARRPDPDA
jgi:hypothetical protein